MVLWRLDHAARLASVQASAFAMQLQTRPEPSGSRWWRAMAAGCLVVASPVGRLHRVDPEWRERFLVAGDFRRSRYSGSCRRVNRSDPKDFCRDAQDRARAFRHRSIWDVIAEVWGVASGLAGGARPADARPRGRAASSVGASCLRSRDGYHCVACDISRGAARLGVLVLAEGLLWSD